MNKLLITAAVLGLAAPVVASAPAVGAPVTGAVAVSGNVGTRCALSLGSATITIPEMSDTSGDSTAGQLAPGKVNGQTASLIGFCDGSASTMQAQAFPILSTAFVGAPPAGFTNRVDFTATATAHPSTGDVAASATSTSPSPGPAVMVGTFASNIDVVLSNATSSGVKLVAGAYQGRVNVTLTPAI